MKNKIKLIPIIIGVLKSDLTHNQKLLTGLFSSYGNKDGECFPSIETLSKELLLSKRGVTRIIQELKDKKIIKDVKKKGHIFYFFVYVPYLYDDYFINPEEKSKYREGDSIIVHKKFKAIYIPYHLILSKELNPEEKLCLGALYTYSYNGEDCIVDGGQKELARTLNLTGRGLKHLIKRLKDKGFIITDREGNIVTYIFLSKFTNILSEQVVTPVTQVVTPVTQVVTPVTQVVTPVTQKTKKIHRKKKKLTKKMKEQVVTPVTQVVTPVTQVVTPVTQVVTPVTQVVTPVTKKPKGKKLKTVDTSASQQSENSSKMYLKRILKEKQKEKKNVSLETSSFPVLGFSGALRSKGCASAQPPLLAPEKKGLTTFPSTFEPLVKQELGFFEKEKSLDSKNLQLNKMSFGLTLKENGRKRFPMNGTEKNRKALKKKKFKIQQEPSTPILEPIKRKLPKIILPEPQKILEPTEPKQIQNLRMFNFIEPVFKILLHWFSKGGKIPQRVSNRKSADQLSYYIEELLMDGLNSIYLPALVNEKEDFAFTLRDKKWKVKEITDSIDLYIDKMGKSPKTFNEFLFSDHNPRYGAYSPLIIAYKRLPRQMSWSAIYLQEMIEARFPDITIPDGTFINTGARLEEMRKDYSVDDNGGSLRFDQPCTLFYDYIGDLANEKGTDVLRYMSSENTFEDFFNAKRHYLRYRDPAVTPEMEDQRAFDIIFKRSQRNREAEVVLGKTFYNHLKEYCKE